MNVGRNVRRFLCRCICVCLVLVCFALLACNPVSPPPRDPSDGSDDIGTAPPPPKLTKYVQQTELPKLSITTRRPIASKYEYVTANYRMRSDSGAYDFDADGSVRLRGNYTMTLTKKPYRVKFTDKQTPIGMDSSRSWYLLNEATDFSLLRNYLAYTYADDLLDYSLRARYVEVEVNEDYKGIYLMTDKRGEGKDRIPVVLTQGVDTGWIVEVDNRAIGGDVNNDNPLASHQPYAYCQREGIDFTKNAFYCVVPSVGVQAFVISEPSAPTPEQFAAIRAYVTALTEGLDNETYDDYLDIDSLARFYMVEELWHDTDVGSVYLYRENGACKAKMGPVWDLDLSCGISAIVSDVPGATNSYDEWYYNQINLFVKPVWYGEKFRAALQRNWNATYAHETADLLAGIDEVIEFLRPYQAANFERWKVSDEAKAEGKVLWSDESGISQETSPSFMSKSYKALDTWENHVAAVKEFLTKRAEWLNTRINSFAI